MLECSNTCTGKNMKYLAAALLSSLVLLSACSGGGSGSGGSDTLKLNYVTTLQSVKDPKLNPNAKTAQGEKDLVFILGKKQLGLSVDDRLTIFDFDKKRIFKVDPKSKSFEDHSLYMMSAFKHAEATNRAMLGQILSKAGGAQLAESFDPFNAGCELGMIIPGQPENPGITVSEKGDTIEFSYKGKVVTKAVLGDPVPAALLPMMEKFYVYNCNLHPYIRKELLARKRVPKELNIEISQRGITNSISMTLKKNEGDIPALTLSPDYKETFPKNLPLSSLEERITTKKDIPAMPKKEESFAEAKSLVGKKEPVDAFLTMMEYSLCTGDQPVVETKEIFEATKKDPTVKKISENIMPASKEAAAVSLKELASIDIKKYKKGYLLEILKGNVERQVGGNPAQRLIYVLSVNPSVVSAYKDLGIYYYSRYDVQNAWDSFDLGRKIKPDHPLFKDIDKLEATLVETHPEYF